ncbi:hypothetical protein LWI28_024929 [Acer negundo]|uniref:Uncharacterized protein n=1 Tax=Acer negundo TaxID=4023 RepID=A0AAD5NVJ0_ACENE|nr:hypothetical protein LWI28_024929 [Acer negundo]
MKICHDINMKIGGVKNSSIYPSGKYKAMSLKKVKRVCVPTMALADPLPPNCCSSSSTVAKKSIFSKIVIVVVVVVEK